MMVLDKLTDRARNLILEGRNGSEDGETITVAGFLEILRRDKRGIGGQIFANWEGKFSWEQRDVSLSELLEAAFSEAEELGHPYVGTEHLLLGLVSIAGPSQYDSVKKAVKEKTDLPDRKFFSKFKSSTPLLDSFGNDITARAENGDLSPSFVRDDLLERVIQILLRKERNNPMLIGPAGVGKRALVNTLAQKVVSLEVPVSLLDKKIVQLDFSSFATALSSRSELEMGFSSFLDEIQSAGDVILFVDEIHTLMGGGSVVGVSSGVVNILKEHLASGNLRLIGSTDSKEYRKHLEFDQGLVRLLQPVQIPEPTVLETEHILEMMAPRYEKFHNVTYSPRAISKAALLSERYISGQFMPDKALDVLDEAGAFVRSQAEDVSSEYRETFEGLKKTADKFGEAFEEKDFDRASDLRSQERDLQDKMKNLAKGKPYVGAVDEEIIAQVVSKKTGIPLAELEKGEDKKLQRMEDIISKRVVGQEQAIHALGKALRRQRAGLDDPRRPIGSFLFLGPTGVGKTELARSLSTFLFGDEDKMIRFDMSEFRERHTTSRLIGAPPGYVGYGQGGELTDRIARDPYSVVVFDEMEKAHPEVLNLLLQIMEEGELTDGQGRGADFRNAIIILTSNVGADLVRKAELGFQAEKDAESVYQGMRQRLLSNLEEKVAPEFLNRLTEVLVFKPLAEEAILEIVDLRLDELKERLDEKEVSLRVTTAAKHYLAEEGYSDKYGARFLNRLIEDEITAPLSDLLISGSVVKGEEITVGIKNGKLELRDSNE
ncbi:MAG: AAA family ATPase [Patescibacteria group bacterium]